MQFVSESNVISLLDKSLSLIKCVLTGNAALVLDLVIRRSKRLIWFFTHHCNSDKLSLLHQMLITFDTCMYVHTLQYFKGLVCLYRILYLNLLLRNIPFNNGHKILCRYWLLKIQFPISFLICVWFYKEVGWSTVYFFTPSVL